MSAFISGCVGGRRLLAGACAWVLGWLAPVRAGGEAGWVEHAHEPEAAGLAENPLKGLMPYESGERREFPHSMEWFYLPLAALQQGPAAYDWEPLERKLREISGRGRQAVFRVYLDYPGRPPGTPRHLVEAGVRMRDYRDAGNGNGASRSPDWNDPRLLAALEGFIRELGAKYDGDRRIGFVTAGLYGFWGEWHNFPHDPAWAMDAAGRDRLLAAYRGAFARTPVLVRDPLGTRDAALKRAFGYHDDSFAYETLGPEWAFVPRLRENGLGEIWKTRPVGGEIRPELQATVFDSWPNAPVEVGGKRSEDLAACLEATRASWLLAEGVFSQPQTAAQRANALRLHRRLGYELHLAASRVTRGEDGGVRVQVRLRNAGVAPFYHRWPAELAAWDPASRELRVLGRAGNWALPEILPGAREYLREIRAEGPAPPAGSRLLLRLVNPLEGGRPLRFASEGQDRDAPGWITLPGTGDEG